MKKMMYKKSLPATISLILALSLAGCSTKPETPQVSITTPELMYQNAQHASDSGNLLKATRILESLASRFPFGPQATQVQLDLIYAYYRQANIEQALATIDRFLRLNPTHPDIDYIMYMRGLTNMQSDENLFHEMFNIDRSDRDPQFSIQAFRDFKQLIETHPTSNYAADAQRRMIALKQKLAKHNIAIAQYYLEREIYVGAINRAKEVLITYNDTPSTRLALEIMKEAYVALKQDDLAQRSQAMIDHNFPDKKSVE